MINFTQGATGTAPSVVEDVPNQYPEFKTGLQELTSQEQIDISNRIQTYEGKDYIAHQKECESLRNYYFSKQWTEEEIAENDERGQYTLVLNKMRKAINGMAGMFSSNKPRFTVIPVGNEDASMVSLTNRLLDYAWYKSKGLSTVRHACLSGLRDNIGYLMVVPDITGDVIFKYLDYTDVVVDPKSREQLFEDSDWIYIKRWIPIQTIKEMHGIDVSVGCLETRPKEWQRLYSTSAGVTNDSAKVGQLIDDTGTYALVYEGQHKRYVKRTDGTYRVEIIKQTLLGYKHVVNEILPPTIKEYSIIPLYTEYTGNPYCRGEQYFLKDYQDLINKAVGVTLLNIQLNGNPKTFIYEKSIKGSLEEFKRTYADVGSLNILTGDGSDKDAKPPITVQGQQLPAAWFQLIQFLMAEMQIASLPNDVLGYKDSSDKVQELLFEKREAVLDSLKLALGHFDSAMTQLGVILLQYIKTYMNKKKVFRIIDAEGAVVAFNNNMVVGLNTDDAASIQRYRQQQLKSGSTEIEIEDLIAKAKEDTSIAKAIKTMYTEIDAIDVDMMVIPGSYGPSYEASQWGAYMRMRQNGVEIDDEDVIRVSPISNRDVVAVKASQNKKLKSQNRALFQENEFLKQEMADLRNIVMQGQQDLQLQEGQYKVDKSVADERNKAYVTKKLGGYQVRTKVMQAQHEIDLKKQEILDKLEATGRSLTAQGMGTSLAEVLMDTEKYVDESTYDLYSSNAEQNGNE